MSKGRGGQQGADGPTLKDYLARPRMTMDEFKKTVAEKEGKLNSLDKWEEMSTDEYRLQLEKDRKRIKKERERDKKRKSRKDSDDSDDDKKKKKKKDGKKKANGPIRLSDFMKDDESSDDSSSSEDDDRKYKRKRDKSRSRSRSRSRDRDRDRKSRDRSRSRSRDRDRKSRDRDRSRSRSKERKSYDRGSSSLDDERKYKERDSRDKKSRSPSPKRNSRSRSRSRSRSHSRSRDNNRKYRDDSRERDRKHKDRKYKSDSRSDRKSRTPSPKRRDSVDSRSKEDRHRGSRSSPSRADEKVIDVNIARRQTNKHSAIKEPRNIDIGNLKDSFNLNTQCFCEWKQLFEVEKRQGRVHNSNIDKNTLLNENGLDWIGWMDGLIMKLSITRLLVIILILSISLVSMIEAQSCKYVTWQRGVNYPLGQIVKYNSSYYKVVNVGANGSDATDPTVSTWYWSQVSCTSSSSSGSSTTTTSGSSSSSGSSCKYVNWQSGVNYSLGQIVKYGGNGKYYKLVNVGGNGSDGTDPTVSTWYWSQVSCSSTASSTSSSGSSSGSSTTGSPSTSSTSSSCNYVNWQSGVNYSLGQIVKFNGNYYKLVNVGANGSDGTDPSISTWYWSAVTCSSTASSTSSPGTSSGSGSSTTGSPSTGRFPVSESQFNSMFPNRNSFYTYAGLVQAMDHYAAFSSEGGSTTAKREAAAFLANIKHETGSLVYIREINQANWNSYCSPSGSCGGKQYYGRGPIQLSWNYNYAAAGSALGYDLLNNPDLVATNAKISWATALWFWMTSTGAGDRTCHASIVAGSFSGTIRTINGALECNKNSATMRSRVQYYQEFCQLLGVAPGNDLTC
ncbi:hypothetical protein DFA_06134 [Cavenderia fasciculata]|uniref:Glycoside hydrolase family 19 catalytic domain-containing protein n=1 Tax=Cavenderia fasciculata TaxID=261658 RepID=F4PK72_CACFS|nr:uncharacterized protein DFA_06134 [Cavenderia fasciculata]EGG23996.1 hypothetical protein DFA_06134 [Cavenderia fasciculata]|eukprot:XP_004361847.1 hypothetical protein DFA_06134 [Cavenderia fasciculata]